MTWDEVRKKFGYNAGIAVESQQRITEIWNCLLPLSEERDREIIIPDNYEKILGGLVKKSSSGKRDWRSYSTRITIMTEGEDKARQERARELRLQEQERKRKEEQDLDRLEELRGQFGDRWMDASKIRSKIGIEIQTPLAEYYWTLVGDKWKNKDWKQNINLEADIYKRIEQDNTFETYSGRNFLNRVYKNRKGYSAYIVGTYSEVKENQGGVYGIYRNEELVYIGLTTRSFEARWAEHVEVIKGIQPRPVGMVLYGLFKPGDKIEFQKLISIEDIKVSEKLTRRDLEAMELGLITLYQPKGNYQGVQGQYKFE